MAEVIFAGHPRFLYFRCFVGMFFRVAAVRLCPGIIRFVCPYFARIPC